MRLIRRIAKYLLFYLSDPRNIFRHETVAITNDGVKFICLSENQIERSILETGYWEPLETNAVKKIVQPGWVVFDVGANIGYYTLMLSKLVGENGQVHGFEPTSYAYDRLQRNVFLNPDLALVNMTISNKGLSSKSGTKIESLESRFSARLLAHDKKEHIEFITLDDYVSLLGLGRVDFIKVDVDGYDYDVILGGTGILKEHRPIIMAEICNRVLKERGKDVTSYLKLYLECGYSSCTLIETEEVLSLRKLLKDPKILSGSWNVLFS